MHAVRLDSGAIPRHTILGYLLRLPFALIPEQCVVRIVQGPLRGRRWITGAGPHGLWLGSYEVAKQKRLLELLQPGQVFFDIGANAGIYTLLFSKAAGRHGQVHAFEPLPENLVFLERHVAMNRADNVRVHPLALATSRGKARFARSPSRFTAHLASDGELEVDAIPLDDFVFADKYPLPNLIKIDVEGGELAVLKGARRLLAEAPPAIFLATHGLEAHDACVKHLHSFGYRIEGLNHESFETTDELVCLPPLK